MGPPHDNDESVTKPSVSAEIARIAFKPPPLWRNNVELWFSQIESQFLISGISQEETKFHHVVAILEEDILSYVSDLVICRPNANPYTQLKNRLISQLADSESVSLRNLLSDIQLGDKKPSRLLHEMQDLSLGKIEASVMRMLWFQRFPITTQQILSASTDKLASLALTADKIAEVSGVRTCLNSVEVESARLNGLEAQISELTSTVQQVQSNYKRFPNASPHRRYRIRFSSRNRSFCWYHSKFGKKAHKCVPPCDFSENKVNCSCVRPSRRCAPSTPTALMDGPFQVLQIRRKIIRYRKISPSDSINRLKPVWFKGARYQTHASLVHPVQRVHLFRQAFYHSTPTSDLDMSSFLQLVKYCPSDSGDYCGVVRTDQVGADLLLRNPIKIFELHCNLHFISVLF
ncbi:hypothetical protein AVEN_48788-1 [Araneus ventricosus]|uniref:DUF7041 domain-containing protein n=1 Tax=Araneus ventricosus TaxID=182803 RepID=A0A4Y2LRP8_ARAVE|nr:hypothetical protein AVEN_48788-1 [Araneus ventricosus]